MATRVDRGVLAPRRPTPKVLDKLLERIRYVPGTFDDDRRATSSSTSSSTSSTTRPGSTFNRLFYLSTAPTFFPVIVGKLGEHGLNKHDERRGPDHHREAVRHRPERGARAEPPACCRVLRRVAGLPHRPLPGQGDRPEHAGRSASRTACSSRSGTATTSTTCRSRRPRTSASARARATTTRRARCATWSRTTCCSC